MLINYVLTFVSRFDIPKMSKTIYFSKAVIRRSTNVLLQNRLIE